MTAVTRDEIRPGLVVHLDTARLRALGDSETNAQRTPQQDRAVADARDFVVVAVDAAAGRCTAVPLFEKTAPGSSPLEARRRAGDAAGWRDAPAFYSHWQHWRIPLDAVAAASDADPGAPGARRTYAAGTTQDDRDALQAIANWAAYNRCEFRKAE